MGFIMCPPGAFFGGHVFAQMKKAV